MDSQLRQISQLVQEKRYDDARAPLLKYLREHPDSAYAWYLLSFVASTPAEKQKAARKANSLAPDDQKYTTRLAKLGAVKKRSPVLPLVILGAVLIAIIAIVATVLRPAAVPPADSTGTVVAQDGTATQETSQDSALASPTGETESTADVSPADVTAATESAVSESTASTEVANQAETGDIASTVDTGTQGLSNAPTQAPALVLPTAISAIDGTIPPTSVSPGGTTVPTRTPVTDNTTPTPFPSVPTVTPGGDEGVALSTPVDIGNGEMRIVAAVRPATTMINDLGGSAANPPSGQQWLLVEALVICSGSANCSPSLTDIRVVGSSGTVYAPAPDFSMPQLFGPGAFAVGQVWGYIGFTIPTSETSLKLALNQDGQTYTFALQ